MRGATSDKNIGMASSLTSNLPQYAMSARPPPRPPEGVHTAMRGRGPSFRRCGTASSPASPGAGMAGPGSTGRAHHLDTAWLPLPAQITADEFAVARPAGRDMAARERLPRRSGVASRDESRSRPDHANCCSSETRRSWCRWDPFRVSGGAGGIRTLDTLLAYTHFPGERLRPLGHRSAIAGWRCLESWPPLRKHVASRDTA